MDNSSINESRGDAYIEMYMQIFISRTIKNCYKKLKILKTEIQFWSVLFLLKKYFVFLLQNWEVMNTAVLTGRQVSQGMKVFIVSQSGAVADVTLQSSCHSEDESVLKVIIALWYFRQTAVWKAVHFSWETVERLQAKCFIYGKSRNKTYKAENI